VPHPQQRSDRQDDTGDAQVKREIQVLMANSRQTYSDRCQDRRQR
jgi:hypothetical protein